MKQARAIIADDETELRNHLNKMFAKLWPDLAVVGEAGDGETALRLIQELNPDIAFLDIKMPALSGLEVAQRASGSCMIVFVTAFNKYAIEAFDHEAVDYLLKPIAEERLEKTIRRLQERLSGAAPAPDLTAALERVSRALTAAPGHLQWIKAQHKDGIRLIPVAEIYYLKATDKYTTVRTREGEFLIRKSIKELEEELDSGQFWRVHRAAIVNARAVHAVQRAVAGTSSIRFKDIPDTLTVSRAYAHLFKQM